ncbi:MAG: aminotransferase class V-fold PLP-dependent enzyme, partial [Ekhidna sp.]|nr:aminotransferase class V-fold PLP-dependent enzyme [Ekhidna sp.]
EKELQKGVKMVAITMASNVTGEILPYEEVLILSRKYGAMCLLDGAQTAGVIPISIKDLDPDFFVFAGHKGPLGPQGIGGLYISERVSMICPSAACEVVPGEKKANTFPSYCDVGSAPMITIAGLSAGIKWLQHQDFQTISTKAIRLAKTLREELLTVPKLSVVGAASCAHHTGAVSISSNEISLLHLNSLLWTEHKIKGSMGFQCAPLAHEVLGTSENGTLRFSLGPMSTEEEIEILIESLKKVVTGST